MLVTPMIGLARAGCVRRWFAVGTTVAVVILGGVAGMSPAWAAQPPVGLGTASSYAVLAGTTVTNTGPSKISGDLGVSPGKAVTGFPPGLVTNGVQHKGDAAALKAKTDLVTGYNDAAGRTPATVVPADLGGKTLAPGVYKSASALGLTGTVTLDAKNDPSAVFVFQAGSTLITASSSNVKLTGGAQACNVFWQVGSSATLRTGSTFVGTIMALTSATVQSGTHVDGRVLARNGQVSLAASTITRASCNSASATPAATTSAAAATTSAAGGGTPTGVPAGSGGEAGTISQRTTEVAILAGVGGLALLVFGVYGASRRRSRRH
jgi:Ice-binding-like